MPSPSNPIDAFHMDVSNLMNSSYLSSDDDFSLGADARKGSQSLESGSVSQPTSSRFLRVSKMATRADDLISRQKKKITGRSSMDEMTMAILRFNELGIVGRESEIRTLVDCYHRLVLMSTTTSSSSSDSTRKEMVLISGSSGTGKTKLYSTLHYIGRSALSSVKQSSSSLADKCPVLVVEGKYDFHDNRDEPYSGIVAAFGQLVTKIKSDETSSSEDAAALKRKIGIQLVEELGASSTGILLRLVPQLEQILPESEGTIDPTLSHDSSFDYDATEKQLKHAFRVLTRVLCSHLQTLILVLDDLQWADVASLDLLDYLISDSENHAALMIVGCYRSDELDESQMLKQKILSLRGKQQSLNFGITDIELGPLSVTNVNEVIMRLLSIDDPPKTTEGLANLCFKRTMGNPYFLIEFVKMLKDEELLTFDVGLLTWTWDEEKIESMTVSTDNVVVLLQHRMKQLGEDEQLLLQYAACLGSSFDLRILGLVATNRGQPTEKMTSLLRTISREHFIEPDGKDKYRWVHDMVQEAALSLGEARQPRFQFEVGLTLYNSLDKRELEKLVFVVADLINQANVQRRPELATLNLLAAEKARRVSAFRSAKAYSTYGIGLLPSEKWEETHRSLTLRLYTLGVQMSLATGDIGAMETYRNEVRSQEECTVIEKFPVELANLSWLCLNSKYAEAVDASIFMLKELDCNFLPNRAIAPLVTMSTLKRMAKSVNKISPKNFCRSQPLIEEPRSEAIFFVLAKLTYASNMLGSKFVSILCVCRLVEMTLQEGIHDESGFGFAALGGVMLTVLGDIETATLLAEITQLLQTRVKNQYATPAALYLAYAYVFPWSRPLHLCLPPLLSGYQIGMRTGNYQYGMWGLYMYNVRLPYQLGKPLGDILARCPECLRQAEEMKSGVHEFLVRLYWQTLLNLSGQSKETVLLSGEVYKGDSKQLVIPRGFISAVNFSLLELHLFYGDYRRAADHAVKWGDSYQKVANGICTGMMEAFHRGVACYAAYRTSSRRKYKKHASRVRRQIDAWKKKGVPNVVHYHVLLDAEQASIDKNYSDAEALYKEAIVLTARPGYLHDAALFNERYADFLRQDGGYFLSKRDDALFRMDEAIRYNEEWGAMLKADKLREERAAYEKDI